MRIEYFTCASCNERVRGMPCNWQGYIVCEDCQMKLSKLYDKKEKIANAKV